MLKHSKVYYEFIDNGTESYIRNTTVPDMSGDYFDTFIEAREHYIGAAKYFIKEYTEVLAFLKDITEEEYKP